MKNPNLHHLKLSIILSFINFCLVISPQFIWWHTNSIKLFLACDLKFLESCIVIWRHVIFCDIVTIQHVEFGVELTSLRSRSRPQQVCCELTLLLPRSHTTLTNSTSLPVSGARCLGMSEPQFPGLWLVRWHLSWALIGWNGFIVWLKHVPGPAGEMDTMDTEVWHDFALCALSH